MVIFQPEVGEKNNSNAYVQRAAHDMGEVKIHCGQN